MTEADSSSAGVPEMVLNITEVARQKVLRVRAAEDQAETLALWLEIAGVANGKYKYDMYFQPADYAAFCKRFLAQGVPNIDRERQGLIVVDGGRSELASFTVTACRYVKSWTSPIPIDDTSVCSRSRTSGHRLDGM